MAKTWTVKEAFEAIRKNDKAAIADFGKRFPLATVALTKAASEDGEMLFGAMPERVTMRVLDAELKGDIEETTEDGTEVEETKPAKKAKAEKAEKPAKAGRKGRPAKKVEPVEEDDEDEVEEDTEEENTEDYSKMGAVDLFKLCKKRGIKVEPKQKASVYIKALEAADADADDDADEGEEEEVKPTKKAAKKAPVKAEKKATKKAPADDDEDEDWDI